MHPIKLSMLTYECSLRIKRIAQLLPCFWGLGLHSLAIAQTTFDAPVQINGQLIVGGNVFNDFQISADGQTVVYRADQITDNVNELFSVPIGGGTATRLNPVLVSGGDVSDDFQISADGQTVIYRADQTTDNVNELFSVPISGGNATRLNPVLVSGGDVSDVFKISADGQTVVYHADQTTDNLNELFSVPISGGNATRLNPVLVSGGNVSFNGFEISADGQTVVYRADQITDSVFELFSVPISGGTATRLTPDLVTGGDVFGSVQISADGKTVVYVADQITDSVFELFSVPISGGTATRLNPVLVTGGDVDIFSGSFQISADGQTVVYFADQTTDNVFEMFSVPISGGPPTRLTPDLVSGGTVFRNFEISADGQTVVYLADQIIDNVRELFSVPISGGPPTRLNLDLVSGGDVLLDFQISADGQTVIYVADQITDNVFELFSVPISGGTATNLTSSLVNSVVVNDGEEFVAPAIAFSPDNQFVVFTYDGNTSGLFELFSVKINQASDNGALCFPIKASNGDVAVICL